MTPMDKINDFLQGQRDCKEGKPHVSGSEDYDRGYRVQYELEQMETERTGGGKWISMLNI